MTRYLAIDDALLVLNRLGFHPRDVGLIASALARPATTVGGADAYPSLDEKAAALLDSVIRNHALLDGNKRFGWTLTALFLWINGYRLELGPDAAFDLIVGLAEGRHSMADAAQVLGAGRRARSGSG